MPELDPFPLFPLHTVLFPGALLPLHIFEPRYRLMVARCLEADAPFGVVLIRAGREVGDPAEPYTVGTKARVVHHERLEDGRMHLVCAGTTRFRIAELRDGEPYLAATIRPLDEAPVEPPAVAFAARARGAFERFLASLPGTTKIPLPTDPTPLSFALAAALPLQLAEQQALLEMTSTATRLDRLVAIVERELQLRQQVGLTRPAAPSQIRPPSPN